MVSVRQIKAARALLDWTQSDLSQKADVSTITLKRLETKGIATARQGTLESIERAFIAAGIEFLDDKAKEGAAILKKIKKK